LQRSTAPRPREQLSFNEGEPDDLSEHNGGHALDIEPQMTDRYGKNDEWRNHAAVDGGSAA
jgi:hypothetical protein